MKRMSPNADRYQPAEDFDPEQMFRAMARDTAFQTGNRHKTFAELQRQYQSAFSNAGADDRTRDMKRLKTLCGVS